MKIRATGDRRLPKGKIQIGKLTIDPNEDGIATVVAEPVEAPDAQGAYDLVLACVEHLAEYLALLGHDAGFLPTGLGDVAGRNLDLEDNPISPNDPTPMFENIGGVITYEGQEVLGRRLDPDGSRRRAGFVVVHNAVPTITPGSERVAEVLRLFERRLEIPNRLKKAMGILHDAACSRERSNAFAQTWTALEVLLEDEESPAAIDEAFARSNLSPRELSEKKTSLRKSLFDCFARTEVSGDLAKRMVEQAMNARAVSQIDVAVAYLTRIGVSTDRCEVNRWRKLRGALVHAAAEDVNAAEHMNALRQTVAAAVLAELLALEAAQSA